VRTTTESEWQSQFVSMFGNIPFFVSSIGSGVLIAILLACVNTMLMAAREQTGDIGIMKALGFTDRAMFGLLIAQALVLCGLGGALGLGLAALMEPATASAIGTMFPNYRVLPETFALGAGVTLAIGLIAGVFPAWRASRLRCVEAIGVVE
jgi:putative ABC transport system permease protein